VDPKEIRELIELISGSNFTSFELEGDGIKLKLVKQQAEAAPVAQAYAPVSMIAAPPVAAAPEAAPAAAPSPPEDDGLAVITSPIVGTFYSASGPDAAPFVSVGAHISSGQVICIVEAMKVMNEIEAEINGEVVEVLVGNAEPVEYGDALFRIRPSK